jgi:hypothetical protein
MIKITIDASLQGKLLNFAQPIELCDPSGRVVGRFFPVIDLSEYELWEPPISEEELQRREQETESYTTEEVLAYLESLGCSESDGKGPQ